MRNLAFLFLLPGAATTLPAQAFTSPKGYDTTEGSSRHGHVLGSTDGLRWQQLDSSVRGAAVPNLKSIAFRRDASLATSANFAARTFTQLGVVLAHTSLATVSTTFAGNYKGLPTTVFSPKGVSAPDWSQKPATTPAAFDFKLLFDQTWSYNGTDDLLWEVGIGSVAPVAAAVVNYPFDFQAMTGAFESRSDGVAIGTGCVAKGQASRTFWLGTSAYDRGTSFAIRHSVNFAPVNSVIYTFLDVVDANVNVPGLCATLHAQPTVLLPLGTASSGGSVGSVYVDKIPFVAAAIGGSVYLQAIGLDDSKSGIQISVSQGERLTIPALPTLPLTGMVWGYSVLGGSTVAGPAAGGVIAQFGY